MSPELETKSAGAKQLTSLLSPDMRQKIAVNLQNTIFIGSTAGLIGIIGFALNLQQSGWEILFLSILIAAASYMSGFFLGFLFGIPKRNVERESAYNLSTNLVDISDWLTKIIIGLGLVEIKRIPVALQSIGSYIQEQTHTEGSVKIFSVCCIVYFSIFGLYYGYNYMRLFLSGQFKEADDNLLINQKKLAETSSEIKSLSPDNTDEDVKQKVNTYNDLLINTKTADNYTFDDWYIKGIRAYNQNDFNSTITYMQNALNKDMKAYNVPDAFIYLAISYGQINMFDQGIEYATKVINDYKNYTYYYLAYYNRGQIYMNAKRYAESLKDFETTNNLSPSYALAYAGKGYVLIALNRLDEGIAALDQSISLDPSDSNTWYYRASAYALKNDKENAILNLKKAIELNANLKLDIPTNGWLNNIRNDEDFKKLLL